MRPKIIPGTFFNVDNTQSYILEKYDASFVTDEGRAIFAAAVSKLTINLRAILRRLKKNPSHCSALLMAIIGEKKDFNAAELTISEMKPTMAVNEQEIADGLLDNMTILRHLYAQRLNKVDLDLLLVPSDYEKEIVQHYITVACIECIEGISSFLQDMINDINPTLKT